MSASGSPLPLATTGTGQPPTLGRQAGEVDSRDLPRRPSARPWRVEQRHPRYGMNRWSWRTSVATQDAGRADVYRAVRARSLSDNAWEYRLVNRDTAEVIHIGGDS